MFRIILLISAFNIVSPHNIAPVKWNDHFCITLDGKPGYCGDSDCPYQSTTLKPNETKYVANSDWFLNKTRCVCCESETAKQYVSQGIQELSTNACGFIKMGKIANGKEVKLMSRPWMALLRFKNIDNEEQFSCGGTIINKRFILTAAHCFDEKELLFVRLGEHDLTTDVDCRIKNGVETCAPPAQDIETEKVFIHEKYSTFSRNNDIALVKLKNDINLLSDSTKPICLPVNETLQSSVKSLKYFIVTGWGRTESANRSDILLETTVLNKERKSCDAYYRNLELSQLCTGHQGHDSCYGDSGGPLAYADIFNGKQAFVQFGIVNFGHRECGNGRPSVYTNIKSFIQWIAFKLGTN